MLETENQHLAEAVSSWLHYKSLTGLNGLFNEASMAVPIAEFLAAKHGAEIESERRHPVMGAKTNSGRPPQIDFVRLKRSKRTWHAAYECKFKTTSYYSIATDICRLVSLSQEASVGKPRSYFVYATELGKADTILTNSFQGESGLQSYYEGILLRDMDSLGKESSFSLSGLHKTQLQPFRAFCKKTKLSVPSTIKTRLEGYSESGKFTTAIWEVRGVSGSKQLRSKEIKALYE